MTPEQEKRKRIADAIEEMVRHMVLMEGHREGIREIKKMIKEEFDISPKESGRLAKIRYKQNLEEVIAEAEELEASYQIIFGED